MSEKHERVVSLIKELAAQFIQSEANTDPLITVTNVTTSPDYKQVTVYITTLPDDKEKDALVFLKRHGGEFRRFIKEKSRLKTIPHIEFAIDRGERHRQHVDEIARDIDTSLDSEGGTER